LKSSICTASVIASPPRALDRFKQRIREITGRAKGVSMKMTMEELAPYIRWNLPPHTQPERVIFEGVAVVGG
jgi:hypothetical protein